MSNGMKYSGSFFGEFKMLNLKDQKQHKKIIYKYYTINNFNIILKHPEVY